MRRIVTPSWITRLALLTAGAVGGVLLHPGVGHGVQLLGSVARVMHAQGVGPGIQ